MRFTMSLTYFWLFLAFLHLFECRQMDFFEEKTRSTSFEQISKFGGLFNKNPSIRIVGGHDSVPYSHPYLVSVQITNQTGHWVHNCGGTVYNSEYVITAAHCLKGQQISNIRVVAAEHNLDKPEGPEQIRRANAYTTHEEYNSATMFNDIGIVRISPPFELNDMVQPLQLPSNMSDPVGICISPGWGSTTANGGSPSLTLKQVDLQIVDRATCRTRFPPSWISDGMTCAQKGLGESPCLGDSGSTLICKNVQDEDYLAGIVSWGTLPCAQENMPTIYVRVGYYYDWLYYNLP